MRLFLVSAAVAAIVLGDAASSLAQFFQQRSGAAPAPTPELRRIIVDNPKQSAPATLQKANESSASRPAQQDEHHRRHEQHGSGGMPWSPAPWLFLGGGYPVIWSGGFTPGAGVYNPYLAPYSPAPQVLPQAIDPPRPADAAAKPEIKPTNADTKARAGKFIGYGDALFAKQNYLAAVGRYRTAAGVAPDMPEPSMRQGFAQVALGSYDGAAKAFRRGLAIRADWTDSPFRLRDLYGADALAKTGHLEALAAAVEANAFDSDLVMVLAIELYFDGQRERAELFFARAAQLGANEDHLLGAFLARPNVGGKPAQAAPAVRNNGGAAKVVF